LLTVVAAFGTWVLIGPDLPAPQAAPARAHEASPSGLATGPVGE
jgi:hypothetical protein